MKTLRVETANAKRHVPLRTCVACRETTAKQELVRLVIFGGGVEPDPEGRRTGRGVYLCARPQCWEAGLKNNRIDLSLRTTISPENRRSLLEYGKSLPQRNSAHEE